MISTSEKSFRKRGGTLPLKTLFELSLYDFRYPRYHLVKKRVIFDRSLSNLSLAASSYLEFQTNDIRGRT